MAKAGHVCVVAGLALLTGGMVFFAAIVTPAVFANLAPAEAVTFLRVLFPLFYAYSAATTFAALAGFLLRREPLPAILMAAILAATLWAWLWLIPKLNAWRAAGDLAAFNRGHQTSVAAFLIELAIAFYLLIKLTLHTNKDRSG